MEPGEIDEAGMQHLREYFEFFLKLMENFGHIPSREIMRPNCDLEK